MESNISNKKLAVIVTVLLLLLAILLSVAYFLPDKTPLLQPTPQTTTKQEKAVVHPSKVLDLTNWKLTLPITIVGNSDSLQEIKQPTLATFEIIPWFNLNSDSTGVVFRAPVNAQTTSNSDYPRSELREMTRNGTSKDYFWSTTTGTHSLFLDQAITAVPMNKPDVVAGQIHGDDDDLIVIRLEYPKLHITRSKSDVYTLDENYTLGKRFTVKFVAQDGQIMVHYNGSVDPVFTLDKKVKQAYFKVGVYTQSNCETEKSPDLCSADNYGEVVVYDMKLLHQ